ncbi:C-type lectin domain-containing protein [Caenorhabditis elegans]|uniref:C-type lectin domain-containing protein n=1 Tax=Caenorhabditis elegans TaxID=6239 RepID=O45262_CAEEL|nr:C-type lectin domain-containing protein [Caenorhabditis elegans]CAB03902.2 C-type lectin domain-containing protein [Caenorhabditis elegans]|eukprot:NP_001256745.2 Uncharacterized protein CELE_C18D4.4 [Caenorhabditis elegans]
MTMNTSWLFLAITISVLPLIQCRHVLYLGSPRVNNQGTWKAWQICHDGWFVHGMQLKYEATGGDLTGMNAVALYCQRIGLER